MCGMRSDPYFKARESPFKIEPVGLSYLKDIHRTYNTAFPKTTYDNAVQFREREREQVAAVVQENELLHQQLQRYQELNKRAGLALTKQSESINSLKSKLKETNVTSTDSISGSLERSGVPSLQEPAVTHEGQREVRPPDVPNTSGHAAEHTNEGRQTSDNELDKQPVVSSLQPE